MADFDLDYETALTVIDSWELLRRKKNYAVIVGSGLFKKFFQEEPSAIAIFGFTDEEIESDEEPFYQSKRFIDLAKNFVGVIDQAVDMLGPEMEMVGEVFVELGKQYKIEIQHYMLLGNLLLEELEDVLGPKAFTDHIKSCWVQVFQVLCKDVRKKLTQAECDLKPPSTQFDDMGRRRRSLF